MKIESNNGKKSFNKIIHNIRDVKSSILNVIYIIILCFSFNKSEVKLQPTFNFNFNFNFNSTHVNIDR